MSHVGVGLKVTDYRRRKITGNLRNDAAPEPSLSCGVRDVTGHSGSAFADGPRKISVRDVEESSSIAKGR
jgi:hypothetical protein